MLDRHLWIDLDDASDAAAGRLDDGLPPDREELGRLAGPEGRREPVRLARRNVAGEPTWAFASATVDGVPRWYADLRAGGPSTTSPRRSSGRVRWTWSGGSGWRSFRLACDLGLVYETTDHQMRTVLEGLEATLRGHPKIWPDAVVVRFKQFGASSLDVEIMAWFQTSDWGEFQAIRQEVLLQFMGVVQAAGTSMAFPTQTVHLHGASGAPPPGRERPLA